MTFLLYIHIKNCKFPDLELGEFQGKLYSNKSLKIYILIRADFMACHILTVAANLQEFLYLYN